MKICTKCKIKKDSSEFNKDKCRSDGLSCWCKTCQKNKNKNWYSDNTEQRIINSRKYYKENRGYCLSRQKQYAEEHKETISIRQKQWREKNKDILLKKKLAHRKNRLKTDINYHIKENLSSRMRMAIKNNFKSGGTLDLIGCTIPELKEHLQNQFTEEMSWENYGKGGWHVDHIIPCSVFDLTDPVEQKQCFHYTNLQPLWWKDNLTKSDKVS